MAVTINTTTTDEAIIYDLIGNKKITGNFSGVGTNTLTYSSVKYFINGARYTPGDSTLDMTGAAINTLYYIRGKTDSTLEYNVSDSVTNRSILAIVYKGAATLDVITAIDDDKLGQYIVKNNLDAVVAPAVTNDISLGYTIGSVWIDTAIPKYYRLLDNTYGAAVWSDVTGIAGSPPIGYSLIYGNPTPVGDATPQYLNAPDGVAGSVGTTLPVTLKLKAMSIRAGTIGAAVTDYYLRLYVNNVLDQTVTVSGAPPVNYGYNTFVGITYNPGDYIALEVEVNSPSPTGVANQIRDWIGTVWFTT